MDFSSGFISLLVIVLIIDDISESRLLEGNATAQESSPNKYFHEVGHKAVVGSQFGPVPREEVGSGADFDLGNTQERVWALRFKRQFGRNFEHKEEIRDQSAIAQDEVGDGKVIAEDDPPSYGHTETINRCVSTDVNADFKIWYCF